ncbi:hypothetical protein D3C81_1533670 [compost metagenome]
MRMMSDLGFMDDLNMTAGATNLLRKWQSVFGDRHDIVLITDNMEQWYFETGNDFGFINRCIRKCPSLRFG